MTFELSPLAARLDGVSVVSAECPTLARVKAPFRRLNGRRLSKHDQPCDQQQCSQALFFRQLLPEPHVGETKNRAHPTTSPNADTPPNSSLIANAAALSNVHDMTAVLNQLESEGFPVHIDDIAVLSPHITSPIKRFGDYYIPSEPEPLPIEPLTMTNESDRSDENQAN